MTRNVTLAALTAVAIAVSSIATSDTAFAASAPTYRPIIGCLLFPAMTVCQPAKPVVVHKTVHHTMKPATKKS